MATANQQVQIADSLPDATWSDTKLGDWITKNAGKAVWTEGGSQYIIPAGITAAQLKSSLVNRGPLSGASVTDPQAAATAAATAAAPAAATTTGQSYLNATGSGNMTWNDITSQGYSSSDITGFQNAGYTPDQVMQSIQSGVASAPTPQQNAFGIKQVGTGDGYTTLQNTKGQNIAVDNAGNYFNIDAQGNHIPVSDRDAMAMGFQSANPETQAQDILKQIDPTSEKLRGDVGQSYADTLASVSKPQAKDYQSYLDLFKQVDPEEYAQRQGLATSMDSYLKQVQDKNALGSTLDAGTIREVEQGTRSAQAARGNVYGTSQLTQEVMQRGAAGEARAQQRQQDLAAALGQQQGYLGAGLGLGDTAMGLYQQGLGNKQAAQGGALSYLSSGQTPYQAGAAYEDRASGNAGTAAQGGPQYNPAALGSQYSASQFPQYGLDVGAQSQSYYNSLNAAGGSASPTKNKTASAAAGALSGAASGAMAGSAAGPGYGTLIGAGVGAVAGGLGGYYS